MAKHYLVYFTLVILCILLYPFELISKNKYTVKVTQPDAVQAPIISLVTVNTENKNLLTWSVTPNENISYFKIYRDDISTPLSWDYLGKANYSDNLSFTDGLSFPGVRSYQYKVSAVDKCGNEIFCTSNVKSINLSVMETNNAVNSLEWNPYVGFNIAGYKIYRGNETINLTPIDTLSAAETNYIDNQNLNENVFYQVEAISKPEIISNGTIVSLKSAKTRSNIASNKTILSFSDTVDASKIQVYPNPMVINAVVVFPYEASQSYQLSILDLTGHTVYTKQIFSGEIEIERKNLKEGLYILQIAGKKIFRKKLIVGSYKA
jgi:hypothetical protein